MLLTSEVVSNALEHGKGVAGLRLESDGLRVRVEVDDYDRRRPRLADAGSDTESGRGLFIVDALSSEGGVMDTPSGKSVWFEVSTGP